MIKYIIKELKNHALFTTFGALTGILIVIISRSLPKDTAYNIYYILHPIHVVLSALVTASIYKLHECDCISGKCLRGKCNFWKLFFIGYIGSVGIATLSDSVIPYLGEMILGMPNRGTHFGFIEKWWLVNPLAIAGITLTFLKPATKFPPCGSCVVQHLGFSVPHIDGNRERFKSGFLSCGFFLFIPGCMAALLCE